MKKMEPYEIVFWVFAAICWMTALCGCGYVNTPDFQSGTLFKDVEVQKVTVTKPDGTKIEIEGGKSGTNAEALKAAVEAGIAAGLKMAK